MVTWWPTATTALGGGRSPALPAQSSNGVVPACVVALIENGFPQALGPLVKLRGIDGDSDATAWVGDDPTTRVGDVARCEPRAHPDISKTKATPIAAT